MSLKHVVLAGAIFTLCAAVDAAPASAQSPNCVDIYRHVMQLYQVAPQSPEYNQVATVYSATCLAGPSAAPGYPGYNSQYSDEYQPSYGYAEPNYPYYGGYGYAVPVGVGFGLGFGGGFHHDGAFRGGNFHHGGDVHDHGGFRGAVFRNGGGSHGGANHGAGFHNNGDGPHGDAGHGGGGHSGGDHHDHH